MARSARAVYIGGMIRAALILMLTALPASADCVVLLHGLARGTGSMKIMEWALERAGYRVENRGYPSTRATVQALAAHVTPAVAACGDQPVHFVTHSMGGILLRQWLTSHRPRHMGRVVMLAPPNQGSELVDSWGGLAVFGWVNGPAGRQLGTGPGSLALGLPPVTVPTGIIAGTLTTNPVSAQILPGPDDGKVTVASTHVEGEADHITLPVTHTLIMNDPRVIAQVKSFLSNGRFNH